MKKSLSQELKTSDSSPRPPPRGDDPNKSASPETSLDSDEAFEVRKLEFAKLCPDYEATVQCRDDLVLPHIAEFIKTSKGGVAVGYHLAKNPQLLASISDLGPHDALAQLRSLEENLMPAARLSRYESWWFVAFFDQFERTATPDKKRAAADLARLNIWEPDTQPH